MPCECELATNGTLSLQKVKIGCQNKGIVSCDGGASTEGHPHANISQESGGKGCCLPYQSTRLLFNDNIIYSVGGAT